MEYLFAIYCSDYPVSPLSPFLSSLSAASHVGISAWRRFVPGCIVPGPHLGDDVQLRLIGQHLVHHPWLACVKIAYVTLYKAIMELLAEIISPIYRAFGHIFSRIHMTRIEAKA